MTGLCSLMRASLREQKRRRKELGNLEVLTFCYINIQIIEYSITLFLFRLIRLEESYEGPFFIPIPNSSNIRRCSIEDLFKLKVRQ
jgi:hypothetical protein